VPQKEEKNSLAAGKRDTKTNHNAVKAKTASTKAKKGKKTSTKAKKGKKASKSKKNVKGEKKAAAKSSRQSILILDSKCEALARNYVALMRPEAMAKYKKQVSRVSNLSTATSAKSGKQNASVDTLNQLITAGGSNISNLTCGTSQNNSGIEYANICSDL
jgi:hypothetical protein